MADRYFSSNPDGGVAARFGTGSATRTNTLIGAHRDANDPRRIVYTNEVVAIPESEYRRFKREYDRALRGGSLVERSADEYRAFLRGQSQDTAGEALKSTPTEPDGPDGDPRAAKGRKGK